MNLSEGASAKMASEVDGVRASGTVTMLVVDDEETTRRLCSDVAAGMGMKVHAAGSAEEALELLDQYPVDIVLTDLKLPETSGLELLKRIRAAHPQIAVLVLTQYGSIDSAVEATRLGALDYVTKPFRIEELRARLESAARGVELDQENRLLREQLRKIGRAHV